MPFAWNLGRCGCNIAFSYLKSKIQAEHLSKELAALGREVLSVQASVADFSSAHDMVQEAQRRFGSVDYLVNNAGVVKDKLMLRMSESDWDEVVDTNLKGAFNFSKAVSSIMAKARFGSILNITSVSGLIGNPGTGQLFRIQSRPDRADKISGQGICRPECYGECPGSRLC